MSTKNNTYGIFPLVEFLALHEFFDPHHLGDKLVR